VDKFIYEFIYDFVASDEYWFLSSYLNVFGNLYSLLDNLLDFINLRNFMIYQDYFIAVNCDLHYLLLYCCCQHWFLRLDLNFTDFLWEIRNNLLNFFYLFMDHAFLLQPRHLLNNRHFLYRLHYFFYICWHFYYLLNLLLDDDQLLNYFLARSWNLERNNNRFFNLYDFLNLYWIADDLIDINFFRDLDPRLNNLLYDAIHWL